MRCAFLTMLDTAGWSIDADLAFRPLADLGWRSEWVPWQKKDVDWDAFDAAYLAATWDYPDDPEGFIEVLEAIDASRAVLVNPLSLVRGNLSKTYLRDLEANGVPIVPSRWFDRFDAAEIEATFASFAAERIIVKPVVSTNAKDTFLLDRQAFADAAATLRGTFGARAFVVQPFLEAVQSEGEYSLFYIHGGFSHAIRKRPAASDFRVQEEHGASIGCQELTTELTAAATAAVLTLHPDPLYARIDFVRDSVGALRLMELELIEPSLYLRMNRGAARRFAVAFDAYVRNLERF